MSTRPSIGAEPTRSRRHGFMLLAALIAVMWGVETVDVVTADNLDSNGIRPRDEEGLPGILWAPFLHGGFGHLLGNTVSIAVLGAVVALGGLMRMAMVTIIVGLAAGIGTWAIAEPGTVHIGASGIAFGYMSYLIVRGLYSRSALHLVASVIVLVLWGGTLLSGLVPEQGISWQGHLFGALGGILAARLLHATGRRARRSLESADW